MGKGLEQAFLQRRRTNGQQVYEKMVNITNQGNANQNHNEISPHTCQDNYYLKKHKTTTAKNNPENNKCW